MQQNTPSGHHPYFRYYFQRENAIQQSMANITKTRHTKRRPQCSSLTRQDSSINGDSNFSRLNMIKLNKGKKYLLDEERNTEIQRSNRILHQKLARCARRSQPNSLKASQIKAINSMQAQALRQKNKSKTRSKKIKTNPTLPTLEPQNQAIGKSRFQSVSKSRTKSSNATTLFMGHSKIDGVQFKIKIVISEGTYYLIAQNEHTRIVLEMPQQEYWALHYQEFQQNPCNIFQYLQIEKGQISFRVQSKQNQKQKKKKHKHDNKFFDQLPKGVEKRKNSLKTTIQDQKLPKI